MRIQHNIAALNAYRNLTNNNSAVSKNLEKLSSGYKINRAGDDAAGLAISEKMRAQITGLNTAQKNANDGISLVQTAEGALTEVHSMLNRMVELATQSANGTYDDAPDRANLQKEIESLKDEINRISKSTNFNGIDLLNGKYEEIGATAASTEVVAPETMANVDVTHIADSVNSSAEPKKAEFTLDLSQVVIKNNATTGTEATSKKATVNGTLTAVTPTDGTATVKAKAVMDFTGVSIKAPTEADGTTVREGSKVDVTIGDNTVSVNVTADMTDAELASAAWTQYQDEFGDTITVDGVELKGTLADGATALTFEADDAAVCDVTNNLPAFSVAAGDAAPDPITVKVTLGDQELEIDAADMIKGNGGEMTGEDLANAIAAKLNNTINIDGADFNVTANKGVLTFKMADDPTQSFNSNLKAELKLYKEDGTTALNPGAAGDTFEGSDYFINQGEGIGVQIVQEAVVEGQRVYAQGEFTLTDVKDGYTLKIGDESYLFSVGKDSKFTEGKNGEKVIKLDSADVAEAARKLSNAAADNKQFLVKCENDNGKIKLTEKEGGNIDYDKNNLQGVTSADRKDADDEAWNGLVTAGQYTTKDIEATEGQKGLVLQIGDTSDSYNQLTVNLKAMDTTTLGIAGIDISTQEGAASAINLIKDAINDVSSIRGDLGAIQNRLEHTINNLSVTAENMTAAESRIRDVDMAEEMMAYTKNNILVQAAQAMLAQANQVPQGVLQLLQ